MLFPPVWSESETLTTEVSHPSTVAPTQVRREPSHTDSVLARAIIFMPLKVYSADFVHSTFSIAFLLTLNVVVHGVPLIHG